MTRLFVLALGISMATIGCRADAPSQEPDTAAVATDSAHAVVDSIRTELTRKLAPVDETFASLPHTLRPDSGNPRADSAFVQQRAMLDEKTEAAVSTLDDPAFQVLVWPDGADGQQQRRVHGRSAQPLSAQELLVADSIRSLLLSHGIWSYRAEGTTYFDVDVERLESLASPFVTDATREALRIEVVEQRTPVGGDAAVSIPWDSVGDRLARTDRFLVAFPDSPIRARIERFQRSYLGGFLTGWDNTSVFGATGLIRPDVRDSFDRYLRAHGETRSAPVVRGFVELLARANYRQTPEVVEYLKTRATPTHGVTRQ